MTMLLHSVSQRNQAEGAGLRLLVANLPDQSQLPAHKVLIASMGRHRNLKNIRTTS